MTGWNTIKQIRDLEEQANFLGMKFAPYYHDGPDAHNVALLPLDQESLPIYSRDAILFAGSLEGAGQFMKGVEWARNYDSMIIDHNLDAKRDRKEQVLRNKQLMETIKNSDQGNRDKDER